MHCCTWAVSVAILPLHRPQTGAVATDYYRDSDLTVGGVVSLWGRKLLLCDCDELTKEYYRSKYGIGELCTPSRPCRCVMFSVPPQIHSVLWGIRSPLHPPSPGICLPTTGSAAKRTPRPPACTSSPRPPAGRCCTLHPDPNHAP